jgi:hypothetical protein
MADPSTRDCYVALELSRAKWLVGALLPGRSKGTTMGVPGGDTAALLEVLGRLPRGAAAGPGRPSRPDAAAGPGRAARVEGRLLALRPDLPRALPSGVAPAR